MEAKFLIARASLHEWEEPSISGNPGSGTVFFGGCLLKCKYCQNYQISHKPKGLVVSESQLVDIFCYLEKQGASNINLVTPSHYIKLLPQLLERARAKLNVPIVYNCGGYESVEGLKSLEGLIDVYLPDFKYGTNALGREYSGIDDYFDVAKRAIEEMLRQKPTCKFDSKGMLKSGVLVRHLVLPGQLDNSKRVLDFLSSLDKNMYVSLMCQYFPPKSCLKPPLNRRLAQREYDTLCNYFFDSGLKNGYCQELASATKDYVPDFNLDILKEIIEKVSMEDKK